MTRGNIDLVPGICSATTNIHVQGIEIQQMWAKICAIYHTTLRRMSTQATLEMLSLLKSLQPIPGSTISLTHPFLEVSDRDFVVYSFPPLGREVERYSGFALEGVWVLGHDVLSHNLCEVAPVEQSQNISHDRRAFIRSAS